MSTSYKCKKCLFTDNKFCNMKRHLTKKNSCSKQLEAYRYSEDQLLILSLLPESEKNINLDHLKKSDIIHKNKNLLFDKLNSIDKNKSKKCLFCEEEFQKIYDLKKHLLVNCFINEINKKEETIIDSSIKLNLENSQNNAEQSHNASSLNTHSLNTSHSHNTNNNSNNVTNIYFEIKSPTPFDNDWDLSQIDKMKSEHIMFSNFMYSKLLQEILNSEINLNVIIDKGDDSGIVYKNDIDKYIQMKSKDIVDNTMEKLKKHLLDINLKSKDDIEEDCIKLSKRIIEHKHNHYKNNEYIKNNVMDIISKIFNDKKDDAVNLSNKVYKTESSTNSSDDLFGKINVSEGY